jgi:CDP-diacylglycerol--serine O-phosphatidyltransferase
MEQPKNNFKIVSDKKARMILPNAITLIGVCIGLTSIKFALDGKFAIAIIDGCLRWSNSKINKRNI